MPLKASANAWTRLLGATVLALFAGTLQASGTAPKPPQLSSSYPLAIERGKQTELVFRGTHLAGARGVWFDCTAFQSKVLEVKEVPAEPIDPDKAKQEPKSKEAVPPTYEVRVAVDVDPTAAAGAHALRVFSAHGVSNPVAAFVVREAAMREADAPHDKAEQAQEIKFPVVLNGRISRNGEVDYYSIHAEAGQSLQLEVATGGGIFPSAPAPFIDPELTVYEDSASWFDRERLRRAEVTDESFFFFPGSAIVAQHRPRFTHRFATSGRYFLAVRTVSGNGGHDHGYQLRVAPVEPAMLTSGKDRWIAHTPACQSPGKWNERAFDRELRADWLQRLAARSVRPADTTTRNEAAEDVEAAGPWQLGGGEAPSIAVATEHEPNDDPAQALALDGPTIVAGAIGQSGDVDYFRVSVRAGDKLAFELQAPELSPPYFNPRLTILRANGETLHDNIYRKIGGDGDDWLKSVEPKMIVSFEQEGDYYVQLRDLTQRRGGPLLQYQLLVRPEAPHVGEFMVKTFNESGGESSIDALNLSPGETRKIAMITALEEGFRGEVAFRLENLPLGVEVFPSAAVQRDIPSHPGETREVWGADGKERFRPLRLATPLTLAVRPDAPPTAAPQAVRLIARPVQDGQLGPEIPGPEILVMVIQDGNEPPDLLASPEESSKSLKRGN